MMLNIDILSYSSLNLTKNKEFKYRPAKGLRMNDIVKESKVGKQITRTLR